jgi:hypothetical protein
VLLAWTVLLCISSGLGHYVTRLQLDLCALAALPTIALQTSVVVAAVWGGLLLQRGLASAGSHSR